MDKYLFGNIPVKLKLEKTTTYFVTETWLYNHVNLIGAIFITIQHTERVFMRCCLQHTLAASLHHDNTENVF